MTPQVRAKALNWAPWIALIVTMLSSAVTWGRTCQRVERTEQDVIRIEDRLLQVEKAVESIPLMAQDIRDMRNFLGIPRRFWSASSKT